MKHYLTLLLAAATITTSLTAIEQGTECRLAKAENIDLLLRLQHDQHHTTVRRRYAKVAVVVNRLERNDFHDAVADVTKAKKTRSYRVLPLPGYSD